MEPCMIKILEGMHNISFAYDNPACFDIHSDVHIVISPSERCYVPTGIRLKLPDTHWMRILSKSGLAGKGIDIGAGVIDSSYIGEIKILVINNSKYIYHITKGDKIAQACLIENIPIQFIQVSELDSTIRGDKGFGSSGS